MLIDELFSSGSKSVAVHPIRAVYRIGSFQTDVPASVLITVSKRHFHHAVDRNRVKRQLRESYRLQKSILTDTLCKYDKQIIISFIWQEGKHHSTGELMDKMRTILQIISDKLEHKFANENEGVDNKII